MLNSKFCCRTGTGNPFRRALGAGNVIADPDNAPPGFEDPVDHMQWCRGGWPCWHCRLGAGVGEGIGGRTHASWFAACMYVPPQHSAMCRSLE